MAATSYSSLVSLMIVLTRYQNPTCPVLFNQSQIQTLLDKVTSLVDFLEYDYDSRRNTKTSRGSIIQALERKITRAANAAEDIVESYYVDRVLDGDRLHPDLEKAIHEMDEIVQESLEVGVKKNKRSDHSMGSFLSQSTDSNQSMKDAPVIQNREESGSMPKHQEDPLALTLIPTTESLLPNLNDNIATSSSSFPPRDKNIMEYFDHPDLDLYTCSTRPYDFLLHLDLEKAIHDMDEIVQESLEVRGKKNKSETDHSMGSFLSLSTDSNQSMKDAPVIQNREESGSMPKHQEDPLALTLTPTIESLLPNSNDNIATSSSSFPPRDKNIMEDLDHPDLDLYACSTRPYDFLLHLDLEKTIHDMDEIVQESLKIGVKKNKSESDHSKGSFLSQSTDSNQSMKHAPVIQSREESGSMPKHQEDPLALTLTPATESLLPNSDDNIATSSSSFPPRDKNTMEDLASSTKTTILVHSSSNSRDKNIVVGFDQQLERLMNLIRGRSPKRKTVPIVGMGGIGKTTLATNAFNSPYACHHFDIRGWVVISQQYVVKNIIASLLRDMKAGMKVGGNDLLDVEVLGDILYKHLYGRRYLIVLDDIWDTHAWDEIRRFFPDDKMGSRILLTTRVHSVARVVDSSSTYEMEFLNDDESFNLLSENVYAPDVFPSELEIYGKAVAKNCKGLPLAIVVIGGVLKKCSKALEYWKEFAENLSSIISKDNGGQCLGVLSLSYTHLPIHLKPCFLHMATFKEDAEIEVYDLINLWIAEGFLKPSNDKNLNDTALEYLNDLIDRNLIVDGGQGSWHKRWSRIVNMHDSLRELCLREAENEDFLCVVDEDTPNLQQRLQRARRIVFKRSNYESKVLLPSMPYARSISIIGTWNSSTQLASSCRLLRVINSMENSKLQMDIPKLVNVRYLKNNSVWEVDKKWDSLPLFWNREIVICDTGGHEFDIWDLQYLRYLDLRFGGIVPAGSQSNCVLKNLQTIWNVKNFICTDEVFRRIPNLKELDVGYDDTAKMLASFSNLARLSKLEILQVTFSDLCLDNIRFAAFPRNLVQLSLNGGFEIPWENMKIVGCLPNLQLLDLWKDSFWGDEWNSSEGEFQSLKNLSINECILETWNAESCHFPRLEHLELSMLDLKEIPLGIGEIDTLGSIDLETEDISIIISAKKIMEERRNNQGDDDNFEVMVYYVGDKRSEEWLEVAKWAKNHHNFRIIYPIMNSDSEG